MIETNKDFYKYIPISVFDVERNGKHKIRGEIKHNNQSSRTGYSPFPSDVAELCSTYFLRDAKIVFDPFAGWGERHKAVVNSGKTYIGYDISQEAIDYAKQFYNVKNILGDSRIKEIPEHDGLITCPPYWNLEKYNSPDGIDRLKSWEEFLREYTNIWTRVVDKTKKGGKLCIIVGDWRLKNVYYDLTYQTERILNDLNLKPFDKVILSRKAQTKIKIMLPQAKRMGYTVKVHETLLVYIK